jgi:GT2 family glycosyltransferase
MTTPHAPPVISVVVPCFNTAPYLPATLKSVEEQTFQDFEVLLVDDGSSDDTLAVLHAWAATDSRFKVIALGHNQGIVAARNAALAVARGEYVALLDSDDVWTPDALAQRLAVARRYPSADVIATDFAWFEEELPATPVGRVGLGPGGARLFAHSFATGEPMLFTEPFEAVASLHFAWVAATLVRRAAMTAIGNFDPTVKTVEDTLLWLRLAQRGAFVFMPQITAYYRQRAGSIIALGKGPKELPYLTVLDWVKDRPEFAAHRAVIQRIRAQCHDVGAIYYRGIGETAAAIKHALSAVQAQPWGWVYWRGLAGASSDWLRKKRSPPTL